jgi:hypothetical protein
MMARKGLCACFIDGLIGFHMDIDNVHSLKIFSFCNELAKICKERAKFPIMAFPVLKFPNLGYLQVRIFRWMH